MRIGRARGVAITAAMVALAAFGPVSGQVLSLTHTATPNALTARTHIAHTSDGSVGYRELGHGSTLLLIMGFGGSMDVWDPRFVDQLAQHFRVVMFDNAGVGKTGKLKSLSIPKMAAQTSALITRLKLGRCDVLGWSMGGMIAQSLAVSHPSQVRALVLAATLAGTGKATPVPTAAAAALEGANGSAALKVLFPSNQRAAMDRFAVDINAYPGYYTSSTAVKASQKKAVDSWLAGDFASGRDVASIRVPTLVADGSVDAVDLASNDRLLASLISGSKLILYPDAGHAFLFQDSPAFITAVRSELH